MGIGRNMKKKVLWLGMALIGYVSLILELTVIDGGILLAAVGVIFSIVGTIGMCVCSKKFREWFCVMLDGPCWWF